MRRHRWVWIVLFVIVVLLLGTLATGWNVVLVRDYQRLVELARGQHDLRLPLGTIVLGTLGFAGALTGIIVFFVKLLREMHLSQMQAEFLATVSHELKTPIATIELTSSLIRSGTATADETRDLWASHDTELRRLKEQVLTLLEAARWQSAAPVIRRRPVRLEGWLEESLARWRAMLGPGARLERHGDPLACEAEVDVGLLNLIADNLVDNARKFSREVPRVTIRTRVLEQTGRWQIRIEDEGWGFDPADAKKIFRRFFRSRTEAPHAIPGTGLGLYLAATASRVMRITLTGESAGHGAGAAFTLEGTGRR
jgi:signal transduction histidine kinase